MNSLTIDLASFIANLELRHVPARGLDIARMGIADCFGVIVAGARDPVVKLVDREMGGIAGDESAALIPSGERRPVESAALVNGVAAHVLDYDDVTLDGHPSAVLVPAILAQGEASGASGAQMLTAYIAGFEAWAEMLVREPTALYKKGWHPTAIRGTIGAAAACAKLRNLDATQTAHALAIASSMAGGVIANFGSMTKSFHVGRAAQSGVIAARLAHAGFTGSTDALEHHAGILAAISPRGEADLTTPFNAKDKEWHIIRQGLSVKRYPLCYATHRSIDAMLDLVSQNNLTSKQVESILVSTGRTQLGILRNSRPQTGLEAKFSMQFAIASALVARNVGLAELTDAFVLRPDVQEIFPRVSFSLTDEMTEGSGFAPTDRVEITTVSGQKFTSDDIAHAKGSHERPLTRHELWVKFSDCLGAEYPDSSKSRTFENLLAIDRLNRASDLSLQS